MGIGSSRNPSYGSRVGDKPYSAFGIYHQLKKGEGWREDVGSIKIQVRMFSAILDYFIENLQESPIHAKCGHHSLVSSWKAVIDLLKLE